MARPPRVTKPGVVYHLLNRRAIRYVEANALRAGLVRRAEDWPCGSSWCRRHRQAELHRRLKPRPVDRPRNWLAELNRPMEDETLKLVQLPGLISDVPGV